MNIQPLKVENLSLGYGEKMVLGGVSFELHRGTVNVVMGGSGCGKSTLLKSLIGLLPPKSGRVLFAGEALYELPPEARRERLRQIGVLYQGGALWSDRTVAENVAFPLEEFTKLPQKAMRELVRYKLALVGLEGADDLYPDELSGGMRKRASLARAMALDPEVLFLDEPSAGLDPLNARRLDDLILQLNEGLGTTFVVVTHDIESVHRIAEQCLFLEGGCLAAVGSARELEVGSCAGARAFLSGYAKAP
jgi:phospholipid/cholesterol/gamma-HCH transport system ATP-binding protein